MAEDSAIYWLDIIRQEIRGPFRETKLAAIEIAIRSLASRPGDRTIVNMQLGSSGMWEESSDEINRR